MCYKLVITMSFLTLMGSVFFFCCCFFSFFFFFFKSICWNQWESEKKKKRKGRIRPSLLMFVIPNALRTMGALPHIHTHIIVLVIERFS